PLVAAAAAPAMAAAAAPAPVAPAPVQAELPPQGLFDAAAHDGHYDQGVEDHLDQDLPPPVYRPQPAQTRAAPPPSAIEADAGSFVAPRPRGPAGQPSPEALARLQAAVSKTPAMNAQRGAPMQPPAQAPAPAAAKPRFGIGSLINRMSGHAEAPADPRTDLRADPRADHRAAPPVPRAQPPVTAYDDEPEHGNEHDRIEIPAFLRRQAN
ncbi:cell division protein FtsZ, partial [Rhodobacteraceae bacterium PA1-206B]